MSERPKRYDGSQRPYDGSPKPKPPPAPPSSQSSPPTLPPVSPENLVEGEWYVLEIKSGQTIVQAIKGRNGRILLGVKDSFIVNTMTISGNEVLYGPIRFSLGGVQ